MSERAFCVVGTVTWQTLKSSGFYFDFFFLLFFDFFVELVLSKATTQSVLSCVHLHILYTKSTPTLVLVVKIRKRPGLHGRCLAAVNKWADIRRYIGNLINTQGTRADSNISLPSSLQRWLLRKSRSSGGRSCAIAKGKVIRLPIIFFLLFPVRDDSATKQYHFKQRCRSCDKGFCAGSKIPETGVCCALYKLVWSVASLPTSEVKRSNILSKSARLCVVPYWITK